MPGDFQSDGPDEERALDGATIRLGDHLYGYIVVPCSAACSHGGLTAAEAEVVGMLLSGHDARTVARLRGSSRRTVENQLASVFRKLGVRGRDELASLLAGEPS